MSDPPLPTWGDDSLSTFLSDAERNERITPLNMPDVYSLLQRVHGGFLRVWDILAKDNNASMLPTRFLMARTHSAWLAAVPAWG